MKDMARRGYSPIFTYLEICANSAVIQFRAIVNLNHTPTTLNYDDHNHLHQSADKNEEADHLLPYCRLSKSKSHNITRFNSPQIGTVDSIMGLNQNCALLALQYCSVFP